MRVLYGYVRPFQATRLRGHLSRQIMGLRVEGVAAWPAAVLEEAEGDTEQERTPLTMSRRKYFTRLPHPARDPSW